MGKTTAHSDKMKDPENFTSNLTEIAEVEENMATTINIVVRLILIVFGTIGNVYIPMINNFNNIYLETVHMLVLCLAFPGS